MHLLLDRDLIIIDVESNGLWGQPFAVASVRMTPGGRILRTFAMRCNIDEVPDEWIVENKIEQLLEGLPKVEDIKHLMEEFIGWYSKENDSNTFVDTGFPVDFRFMDLMRCNAAWQSFSPYPLYDISSILVAAGEHPNVNRMEYAKELIGEKCGVAHNPIWDAEVSGLCAIRALRKIQALYKRG